MFLDRQDWNWKFYMINELQHPKLLQHSAVTPNLKHEARRLSLKLYVRRTPSPKNLKLQRRHLADYVLVWAGERETDLRPYPRSMGCLVEGGGQ